MKNSNTKFILAALVFYSFVAATIIKAAPVRFNQVQQVVSAKPSRAKTGDFSRLRLTGDNQTTASDTEGSGKDAKPSATPPGQDDRVIVETEVDVVEDADCNCTDIPKGGGFPYWTLGFAAIPLLFLIPHDDDTPPGTPPSTPPPTPTPTPEPMTILLFGTGLAGIGMAARKKFGKQRDEAEIV